ncbi:MAG: hypothetical protein WBW16_05925 [Bacteroidota bacterium]
MTEWLIKLKGSASDMRDLPSLFTSANLTVKEEDGEFYLTSLELNQLDNKEEVVTRTQQLLDIISAAATFHFERFTPLDISDHIMIDENGVRREHLYLRGATGLSHKWLGTFKEDGIFIPANQSTDVDYLVRLSMRFDSVAKSLQLFREDTWVSLYKVYEIIRTGVGGEDKKIIKTKWTTDKILRRFKHTAQSHDVLGAEARLHDSKRYPAPLVPMSKFEAHYFIKELLLNWIRTKRA